MAVGDIEESVQQVRAAGLAAAPILPQPAARNRAATIWAMSWNELATPVAALRAPVLRCTAICDCKAGNVLDRHVVAFLLALAEDGDRLTLGRLTTETVRAVAGMGICAP